MQNYQNASNYGYGYPVDSNNSNKNNLQSSSSVQFYDPNSKNTSNNFYQGPQNLGYSSGQNMGYSQGPSYGYSNTSLNTGLSIINTSLNTNKPQFGQYSSNSQNLVQNTNYSSNAQNFGYNGSYSQNINQPNYQIKQGQAFSSTGQKQILFKNVAIVAKNAKKTLDVCQDKGAFGMLIIYDDYKEPNQRFHIIQDGDSVNIVSVKSGKYVTVGANSDKNGAPIFQQPSNGLIGQKFRLQNIGGSQYLIHTFCGKVLDCCEESTSNGTRVIQWDCDRKIHQIWTINI